ncbi:hypothetical protein TWF679_008944 [Orbilia oligospora]|uniref:Uncharacterized protein n=1 Tax=Orbilia oligospora TaxID=2813651 RepID=A0A8H8VJY4_ORBOL|nr:hypothetical protein TWF679_008944 [Orbilia oligospora]
MSSFNWQKPDGHCTSMKYADQSVGFVEPAAFVTPQHWQYGEDVKEGILETINGFSHIAPVVHGSEEEEGLGHDNFGDGEYGEIEITIKFRGRTGSSTTSRKLRLTSNPNSSLPTVLKLEQPTDDFPQCHRIYSARENRGVCIVDADTGCACNEFSPSILRELLQQTITPTGLSIDPSFDHRFDYAVSDFPSDENVIRKSRKASISSGKKRLLSNASEEHSQILQPNKKNPRLAAPTEGTEENDGEDTGERHTCPYFKMYPEKHLECGTKDLAQRPKIKSHIIKDHLKKTNTPIPPEIKSQKCEPWDRWCKWIVQNSSKSDRPVPNSTPDFYPILNYVVAAASEIPSDGLTCFSSVILRLFKAVQTSPNEWVSFITGLEELERSLNVTSPILGAIAPRRTNPAPKEEDDDEKLAITLEADDPTSNCDVDDLNLKLDTSLPSNCSDLSLTHYPTSATSTTADSLPHPSSAYTLAQHHPTAFSNIPEHTTMAIDDFANSNPHNIYSNSDLDSLSMYFNFGMADTNLQDSSPALQEFYEHQAPPPPPPPQPQQETVEPPPMDHLSIPPGIGTNSKSLVRAAAQPRVRKRKHAASRPHRPEGAFLGDSGPAPHTHSVKVSSPSRVEIYEFEGQFSVSNFLEWLQSKFDWQFGASDGRKLHCRDVREDIVIDATDAIVAHLGSWATKGVFVQMPEFWLHTDSPRTLGMDKYSMFTPALVERIQDGGFEMENMSLLLNTRPGSSCYR